MFIVTRGMLSNRLVTQGLYSRNQYGIVGFTISPISGNKVTMYNNSSNINIHSTKPKITISRTKR